MNNNNAWIDVKAELPEIGKDVWATGHYFNKYDQLTQAVEEGFRSEIDKPDKPSSWADFYFTVTHWMYKEIPQPPCIIMVGDRVSDEELEARIEKLLIKLLKEPSMARLEIRKLIGSSTK